MKRKFLTLVLILSLLVGMALPLGAMGETSSSLIQNGSFENVAEENETIAKDWLTASGGEVVKGSSAHSGERYLYIPFGKAQKTTVALKPETQYMLRFWAKTTIKDASYFEIYFTPDASGNALLAKEKTFLEWFGIENEAPKEGESIDNLPWQEISFAFTTPAHIKSANISISANVKEGKAGGAEEHFFYLDDVSLTATDREPNLIRNGYLTAFKVAGKHPSGWTDSAAVPHDGNPEGYSVKYVEQENGEVYAEFTDFQGDGILKWIYYINNSVPVKAGRYKLSFEYENNNPREKDRVPFIMLGTIIPNQKVPNMLVDRVENKYEFYFTVTTDDVYSFTLDPYKIENCILENGEPHYLRISNIRLWKDSNEVQYGKTATYNMDLNGNVYRDVFVPVSKISDADKNAGGTAYVVLPKGHYVPETSETETFTMVNVLYRKYKNGNIILENVKLTGGVASGGAVSNLNDSIEVPVLAEGADYTYEIHSFMLSGMDTLKAMNEKTILTY